jgi:hypothetical protein
MSDSDTDTEISEENPALKKKLSRKRSSMNGGDAVSFLCSIHSEMLTCTSLQEPGPSSKKAKEDEEEKPTLKRVNTRGKKQKCMYWDKCFHKDADHKEMYAHPGDPENSYDDSEKDDRGKKKPKVYRPKHKAGLTVLLAHKWTEE